MTEQAQVRKVDAVEIPDFTGHKYKLEVTGQAYVRTTGTVAMLKEHVPQGINRKILILDLIEEGGAPDGEAPTWKDIEKFEKSITARQYDEVQILRRGTGVVRVKVRVVKS
jgi:hypothetical protein